MTSFRRAAFPLGLAAICGGALLFSLSTARGQTAATPMAPPAAPTGSATGAISASGNSAADGSSMGAGTSAAPAVNTGSPTFPSTIGASPTFPTKNRGVTFNVIGGTGNESYDLQIENLYSLLRERGVPIPNVLHPLSTAKPSFIVEKLITLILTGSGTPAQGGGSSGQSSQSAPAPSSAGSTGEGAGAATADEGAYQVAVTLRGVERIINAEISRGTGRSGGAHRTKLVLLSRAVGQLVKETEAAIEAKRKADQAANAKSEAVDNQVKSNFAGRVADSTVTREGERVARNVQSGFQQQADQKQAEGNQAQAESIASTIDKNRLEAQARFDARAADRYTPNIP